MSYRPSAWRTQRAEVEALFRANEGHAGLLQAQQFLADFIARACADPKAFKGAVEVARLPAHGITPHALLVELCAAWAWQQDCPHSLPSDEARDFALSRAILGLAPAPRRPCGSDSFVRSWLKSYSIKPKRSALAFVGKYLRQTLAVFLATTWSGIEAARRVKADPQAPMREPLRLPFPTR
jgi:hypothetical protein